MANGVDDKSCLHAVGCQEDGVAVIEAFGHSVLCEVAQLLREEGLPIRDVGELIGVSHQRVSQILAS